ncbi:MAG: CPBP family intramembrane metalloprotease [Hyphomonadaceae bacterium]|nr:CPBP family intramembrane metalloprotease [Hyphomonadaceae bacterium]
MNNHRIAAAALAAVALSTISGDLIRPLLSATTINQIPHLASFLISCCDIGVFMLLVGLAGGTTPDRLVALSGIGQSPRAALALGAAVFLPSAVLAGLVLGFDSGEPLQDHLWLTFGGPVMEEFLYRGLAIGVLMQLCNWRFLPAALAPAVLFGLAHVIQGEDPGSIAGIVAITFAGGLLFGWLFVRWGFNLWPAIVLHVGLNGLFNAFPLGDSAILGWFGNGLRLAVAAAFLAVTLWWLAKLQTLCGDRSGQTGA